MRFKFDALSFWLGAIVASIFWGMLNALKPSLEEWREKRRRQREERRQRGLSALEDGLREAILQQTQDMHLAGTLFSLDEIAIPPSLVAPPAHLPPAAAEEDQQQQEVILAAWEDITTYLLPYMPDWPEMAALYHAPSLTLGEALSKGADLALIGELGSGKTTALAWLAARMARQPADLHPVLQNKLGFLVHAADVLALGETEENLLAPVQATLTPHANGRYRERLGDLLPSFFQQGRALLLLDGVDELPPDQAEQAIGYLAAIRQAYPKTQMIVAASRHYIDGLLRGGFVPLALRPWDPDQRRTFFSRWQKLWENYVLAESWAQELPPPVDSALLNIWLREHDAWYSPLELTLYTWALYAGDIRGPSAPDAIYAHLRRLLPENIPFQAIETLGLQAVLNRAPVFTSKETRTWLKTFEEALAAQAAQAAEAAEEGETESDQVQAVKPSRGLIERLLDSGLLQRHAQGKIRFSHPLFAFYLAGRAAARVNLVDALLEHPEWAGKYSTLHYLAAYGQAALLVDQLLAQEDELLLRPLLETARWLRDAPPAAPWRQKVLLALAQKMMQPHQPQALRGRLASAAALSRSPGVQQLFIKQMQQGNPNLLLASILSVGLTGAPEAVAPLSELLEHPDPSVYRAAVLALIAIGSNEALDAVAIALVNGHDELRQAAAEALANHPREGHPTLQEAARRTEVQDTPLRRAAVYGLARIRQTWARTMLDELQYDSEWVVRNAAVAILEGRSADNPHIPQPLTPPAETPWLLAFAARQGMGISPQQDPTPILLQTLQYGEPQEKLAAIAFLQRTPSEGVLAKLYETLRSDDDQLQSAAYTALFWIAASGFPLPPLKKYGLD